MAEYIELETAVKIAEKYGLANGSVLGRHSGLADCITSEIESLPVADAAPMIHGHWIEVPWVYYGAKQYICSQCKDDEYWKKRELRFKEKYCPNCGAEMMEKTHESEK